MAAAYYCRLTRKARFRVESWPFTIVLGRPCISCTCWFTARCSGGLGLATKNLLLVTFGRHCWPSYAPTAAGGDSLGFSGRVFFGKLLQRFLKSAGCQAQSNALQNGGGQHECQGWQAD